MKYDKYIINELYYIIIKRHYVYIILNKTKKLIKYLKSIIKTFTLTTNSIIW